MNQKVLLSAYACLPDRGSEDGVGWNWVVELAKTNRDVTVVTQKKNQDKIESASASVGLNVEFIYYELPKVFQWKYFGKLWPFKKGLYLVWHVWHYPYHFFWQLGAYLKARKVHKVKRFDVVHHVTFATMRRAIFMGFLPGVQFIFGPAGGGEAAPERLRRSFGLSNYLFDAVRDFSILLTKYSPWVWLNFFLANQVYATTNESARLVIKPFRNKVIVKSQLAISDQVINQSDRELVARETKPIRFLFVGRFIYWKGMGLGLEAFAQLVQSHSEVTLTVVGDGAQKEEWRSLCERLRITEYVDWLPWLDREKLWELYDSHDVFLFPSLHDSGGMVVLEALSRSMPVVCLDLGGPAVLVDDSCGYTIDTCNKSAAEVVTGLRDAMAEFVDDHEKLVQLSFGAKSRSKEFLWENVVDSIYGSSH